MPSAARMGDSVLHDAPHCHAPIHPPAPTPTPMPHAPVPIPIVIGCPTVNIGGQPAARAADATAACMPPGCVPGSQGSILMGSTTVNIGGKPAARAGDRVLFAGCATVSACVSAKIIGPGCPTV